MLQLGQADVVVPVPDVAVSILCPTGVERQRSGCRTGPSASPAAPTACPSHTCPSAGMGAEGIQAPVSMSFILRRHLPLRSRAPQLTPQHLQPQERHLPPNTPQPQIYPFLRDLQQSIYSRTRAATLYQHFPSQSLCSFQSHSLLCFQHTGVFCSPGLTMATGPGLPRCRIRILPTPSPRYEVPADVQEDEEALLVGCVGPVGAQRSLHLLHGLQVKDMQVDLLSDGRRLHRIRDDAVPWPGPAVHIQVPWGGQGGVTCTAPELPGTAGMDPAAQLTEIQAETGNRLLEHSWPCLERITAPERLL